MPDTLDLTKNTMNRGKQTHALSKESLGGLRIVVRPLAWAAYEELTCQLNNLSATEKDTVMTFIETHQGIKVDLRETYNAGVSGSACADQDEVIKTWRGYITSSRITHSSKRWHRGGLPCDDAKIYDIIFTFQGNLV